MLQNPYTWVALAFLVFVGIVVKMAGKSILGGLDERAARIRQDLEQAQKLREDAQAALAQYQRKQRDALKEAEAIVTSAREEADRIRKEATAELTAVLKRREAQAMEKIAQAESQAVQQVRDLAVDIAMSATERLLVQTVDQSRSDALIEQAIADLPRKLN